MPAYVIAAVDKVDPEAYDSEYGLHARQTIASHEGKLLTGGPLRIEGLEGDWRPSRIMLIEFPTFEQAREWYGSPEYQALIPRRPGGCMRLAASKPTQKGRRRVADKEFLGDRRRIQEEEYFQRQEQELIAKLQQRGRQEATRQLLAERAGVVDKEILQDLEALGFTPETVMVLHLVPLIQMAWAEGGVSDRERALVNEAARARGIEVGSPADQQLATWLAARPSDDLFEKALRLIGAILQIRPQEREASQRDLLSYSSAIASASGGILGLGKVSAQEQNVLARISDEIERARSVGTQPARPRGEDGA
jgi:uncharacterized protein (DUF1330 family)